MKQVLIFSICVLMLTSCNRKAKEAYMPVKEVVSDTVMVMKPESDTIMQHIVDSIKSKERVTQQDIDFVREHSTCDWDISWCIAMENKRRYDNIHLMCKKLYKNQNTSELARFFEKEQNLFEQYKKACVDAFCTSQEVYHIGSATGRSLFMSGIEEDCCHQLKLADEDVLRHLCGDNPTAENHRRITRKMINEAYVLMIDAQKDSEYDDSEVYSRENKQNLLRKEQKAWNNWIAYRGSMSENLPVEARTYFDNGTNNLMRHKLIQLKNQYADVGIVSDDILRCSLPYDCSDKDLMEYSSFDQIWSIYSEYEGSEWTDWKNSLNYGPKKQTKQ